MSRSGGSAISSEPEFTGTIRGSLLHVRMSPPHTPNMRACALLLLAIVTAAIVAVPGRAAARPPNIVLIVADDLGYADTGCYGQKLIDTPHIDRLAAEGMRFTQAYAGGPVCTASRSVLMTGLHNGHTPARDNVPHYHTYLEDEDVTLAEVLKPRGYRCGGVGKWSLGDAGTVGRATRQGFDTWFGYLNQDHAHYYFTEYLDDDDGRLDLSGNTTTRDRYSHDLLTDRALQFIQTSARAPFFLYAAYTLPHFSSTDEDADGLSVPSTAPYTDRNWDQRSKKYAAMVSMLDRDVGRIVAAIDDLGLADDTLIIFTSDNGGNDSVPERFHTNGPLRGFKRDLTEGGIRVPFIARWQGTIAAGTVSDEVIAFQDLLPTFAEIAAAHVPAGLDRDGISIVPALKGGTLPKRSTPLYWDYGHCRGDLYAQAVRLDDFKGIRSNKTGPIELSNLHDDIGETKNIAANHPHVVERIREIMDTSVTPSPRYRIGTEYKGSPIWHPATAAGVRLREE